MKMMKRFLPFCCFFASFLVQITAFAQAEYIYTLAHGKNIRLLEEIKRSSGSLDWTDSYGQTALCLSIYRYDYPAFFVLSKLGASRQHQCVGQIDPVHIKSFNQRYQITYQQPQRKIPSPFKKQYPTQQSVLSSKALMVGGGVLGVGALVALAAGGGGGGSGSGGESSDATYQPDTPPTTMPEDQVGSPERPLPVVPETPMPETPDSETTTPTPPVTDPIPDETEIPYTLKASDFETVEYYKGNFLKQINAASAYASVLKATKSSDGTVNISTDHIQKVKVAVIDTGVYNHNDLPSIETGFNFDYGPCQNDSQRNCWVYKDSFWNSGVAFRDENGREEIFWTDMTEEEFNNYKEAYDTSYDWENNKNLYTPLYDDHGTHVSGIIAATKNGSGMMGVAPNAALIPIRYDFLHGLSKPIQTAVDNGAKVINASLGSDADEYYNAAIDTDEWKEMQVDSIDGFEYLAEKKSTVFVISAGNLSYSEPSMEAGAGLHVSGLDKLMLTVVSTKTADPTKLASYSNQCGSAKGYCLAAPGGDDDPGVNSTVSNNGYASYSGTSMAAPIVSGAAAFVWGTYPNLSAADVASILLETATDIGDAGVDAVFGHGLLNLNDAVNKPLGTLSLATTQSVLDKKIGLNQSKLRLPSALKTQILKALPTSVSILDKYERSFKVPTKSFVKSAYHNPDAFKNKLKRFSSFEMKKRVQTTPVMSFGFLETKNTTSDFGIGEMDVSFDFDKHQLTFYFAEDAAHSVIQSTGQTKINPFRKMTNAVGIEERFKIADKMSLKTNFVTGENAFYETDIDKEDEFKKQTFAFDTEFQYQPTEKLLLGFLAGALYEKESLLGLNGGGAFDIQNSKTYYFGTSIEYNPIPNLYLTGAYYVGMTQKAKQTAFLETSKLMSEGFFVDAHYELSEKDYIGLSLTSPLRISKGTAVFDLPTGRDYYSDTVYRETYRANLKPDAREIDYALYYGKNINSQMKFKAETGVRVNPDHQQKASNDYQILFGFDWKFN